MEVINTRRIRLALFNLMLVPFSAVNIAAPKRLINGSAKAVLSEHSHLDHSYRPMLEKYGRLIKIMVPAILDARTPEEALDKTMAQIGPLDINPETVRTMVAREYTKIHGLNEPASFKTAYT